MKSARLFAATLAAVLLSPSGFGQSMTIDSLDGPVTASEIASFRNYIQTLAPATWATTTGMENEYAQGHSGENIKAMGLMYEISGDTAILDRMVFFCDTLLSQRNDLLAAPNGQQVYNTGAIAPAWPSSLTSSPIYSTSASGDCAGHLAYCARLILQSPALWSLSPSGGDPFGFGATYLQRAQRYVTEADTCFSQYFFPSMLDLSDQNHLKYSAASPYQPGNQLPWNQTMMMVYPLQNLAAAHQILGDNPSLAANYDNIVLVNLTRFFTDPAVTSNYVDHDNNFAYDWGYTPFYNAGEDSNHGALDVSGFWRAYHSGRYGITAAQLVPFANAFCDVQTRTVGSDYAGTVDGNDGTGHAGATTYVRSGYLFLAQFRPDQYYNLIAGAELAAGASTGSTDAFSRAMWEKNERYLASQAFTLSAAPGNPAVVAGSATSFSAVVTPQNQFGGQVSVSVSGLPAGAAATVTPATLAGGSASVAVSTTAATVPGQYPLIVTAISGDFVQAATVQLAIASTTQATAPTFAPAPGTYTTIPSVAMTTPTPQASIRYTTDGSTPSATTGTLYTGPVTVAASETLQAIAVAPGLANSLVTSGAYILNLPAAAAPVFNIPSGQYAAGQTITLSSTTPGASIYYTLDGSTPTAATGVPYAGPVAVAYTTSLQAIAVAYGYSTSGVAAASYVIGSSTPQLLTSPATNVTDSGHTGSYGPANTLDGNTTTRWASSGDGVWIQYDLGAPATINQLQVIWYSGTSRTYTFDLLVSLDGVTWTTAINRHTSSGATAGFEAYDFAPVTGQFVRVVGHESNVDSYINVVELQLWGTPTGATGVVAPPAFGVAAGTYPAAQSVSLTSTTPGATLRYTLNGATPSSTVGTLYSGPVTVATTSTLRAIAYASGLGNSTVVSAAYTIGGGALPTGWADQDIGSPAPAGSATFAGGVFTLTGSGADIWTTADQFHYAYTGWTGDGTLTARVATLKNTNVSAKSGVMFRESTAANSRYVIMFLEPTHGVALQYRSTTGASAVQLSANAGPVAPYWMRLTRAGNVFTGFTSPDGIAWTNRGSVTVAMAAAATLGLPVCSHASGTLTTSTLDNVQPPLAQTVTASAPVTASGLRLNRATGLYAETVTLTNATAFALPGPLSLVFDGLPAGVTVNAPAGTTAFAAPAGSPFVATGIGAGQSLAAGASISFTVQFSNPANHTISYAARVLAGPGSL